MTTLRPRPAETSAQATWADRLEDERENLRAAFDWAASRGDGETLLRFVAALYWFWVVQGHLNEGRDWLQTMLTLPTTGTSVAVHAKALHAAGSLA